MEKLYIEATSSTPMVHFDPQEGLIEFRGISSTENSSGFYAGILVTLDEFLMADQRGLTANLSFNYFNTSSSKCLFDMLKRMGTLKSYGRDLTINWFYAEDDEDMREVGEDYSRVLNLRFNFIKLSA